VYDRFVRGYTQKQWGISPALLEKELAGRFEVSDGQEPYFSRHSRQGIPQEGYAALMRRMMDGIPHLLDFDYLRHRESVRHKKKLIFTGPIDEFFAFDLGKLKYRAQRRVHEFFAEKSFAQPVGQVNNPGLENGAFIRTLEWKHMMPIHVSRSIQGTVLTREYPFTPDDPNEYEYPFPDSSNRALYARYRERASQLSDTLICGRLGEYRYLDMDQAMARALMWSQQLLTGTDRRPVRGFQ
jgi:UDP-galactopyranose mutase